mmetsp:Transcript_8023/g.16674  ORF Transcript_8023/g.16674 Transcript_8023/m.16674 type:complete len:100 (+) Transcript_8023:27-326(+)
MTLFWKRKKQKVPNLDGVIDCSYCFVQSCRIPPDKNIGAVFTNIVLEFPFLLSPSSVYHADDEDVSDDARSISRSMFLVDKIRQNPFIPNNPLLCSAWE